MFNARRLALDGVLAALYFALSYLSFYVTPNLKVAVTSLAIVVAALMLRWYDACLVALIGEFLYQLLRSGFGITVTTPVWIAVPVLHALALGLCMLIFRRKDRPLVEQTDRTVLCVGVILGCGVINALLNTCALYVDSKVYGYYQPHLVFGLAAIRIVIALATAGVMAVIAIPLVRAVRRQIKL